MSASRSAFARYSFKVPSTPRTTADRGSVSKAPLLLYGLQRSGTNYVEQLIVRNVSNVKFVNNLRDRKSIAHKHFRLYKEKSFIPVDAYANDVVFNTFSSLDDALTTCTRHSNVHYIVVQKSLHAWLISIRKWALKCQWPPVPLEKLVCDYREFYKAWEQFAEQAPHRVTILQYKDVLRDPQRILQDLCAKNGWQQSLRFVDAFQVRCSGVFTADKRREYLQKDHTKEFTCEELNRIEQFRTCTD